MNTSTPVNDETPRHFTVTSVRLDEENYREVRKRLLLNNLGTFSDFVNAKMIEFLTANKQ